MVRPSLLSLTEPVVIAHRGGSKLRPENTLPRSITPSRSASTRSSATSTSRATASRRHPRSDARAHDGCGWSGRRPSGRRARARRRRLPVRRRRRLAVSRHRRAALAELLDRYRAMPIVVEIKGDRPEVGERALDVVREAGALDRVISAASATRSCRASAGWRPRCRPAHRATRFGKCFRPAPAGRRADRPAYRLFQVPFRFEGRRSSALSSSGRPRGRPRPFRPGSSTSRRTCGGSSSGA